MARHVTAAHMHEIDVRALKREGRLVPGACSVVTKRWGGRVVCEAVVDVCADGEGVMIHASGRALSVELVFLAQPFGGRRPYFACPSCGHRAAILYPFSCRACSGVAYASQWEPAHHRAIRRAQHHRQRIGGSVNLTDPLPPRPWGMWDRTYRRRIAACREADARSLVGSLAALNGLRIRPAG